MLFWWCRPAPLTNGRATLLTSALGPSMSAAHPLHPAQRTNAEESFRSALGQERTSIRYLLEVEFSGDCDPTQRPSRPNQ